MRRRAPSASVSERAPVPERVEAAGASARALPPRPGRSMRARRRPGAQPHSAPPRRHVCTCGPQPYTRSRCERSPQPALLPTAPRTSATRTAVSGTLRYVPSRRRVPSDPPARSERQTHERVDAPPPPLARGLFPLLSFVLDMQTGAVVRFGNGLFFPMDSVAPDKKKVSNFSCLRHSLFFFFF